MSFIELVWLHPLFNTVRQERVNFNNGWTDGVECHNLMRTDQTLFKLIKYHYQSKNSQLHFVYSV